MDKSGAFKSLLVAIVWTLGSREAMGSPQSDAILLRSAGQVRLTVTGTGEIRVSPTSHLVTRTSNGAPTDAPSPGALVVDTTNNTLYVRSNNAWNVVGGATGAYLAKGAADTSEAGVGSGVLYKFKNTSLVATGALAVESQGGYGLFGSGPDKGIHALRTSSKDTQNAGGAALYAANQVSTANWDDDLFGVVGIASTIGAMSGGFFNKSHVVGVHGKASIAVAMPNNTIVAGLYGESSGDKTDAVRAVASGSNSIGVNAQATGANSLAGYFSGAPVRVTDSITIGSGSGTRFAMQAVALSSDGALFSHPAASVALEWSSQTSTLLIRNSTGAYWDIGIQRTLEGGLWAGDAKDTASSTDPVSVSANPSTGGAIWHAVAVDEVMEPGDSNAGPGFCFMGSSFGSVTIQGLVIYWW